MAMFEVEGKSDIKAKNCSSTSPTLVKSSGENSDLKLEAENCRLGVETINESQPIKRNLLVRFLKCVGDHSFKTALGLAIAAAATYFTTK